MKKKQVICIETGQIFDSCCDAARAFDRSPSQIWRTCMGYAHSSAGKHFEFYEGDEVDGEETKLD